MKTAQKIEQALEKHFGFTAFRPVQDEIVAAVYEGRNVLGIMPTGGGKSLCYQLPALMRDGVALIVSPLISLMKDQIDVLTERGLPATFINSSVDAAEQGRRIQGMVEGEYKMVYIAPERFRNRRFVEELGRVDVSFVAVDEAHCVSQWGHDFRPDYLKIGAFLSKLGRPQVCGFTATATPEVRKDITEFLQLEDPAVFVTGFARPNLSFRVFHAAKRADKYSRISELVEREKKGIIYCATRKRVEEVAERLASWEIPHVAYHGGLDDGTRERQQTDFMQGKVDVAVATNAFGMGIDRSDIRFVAHFDLPGSVEAYYQEAGRAGRDGMPAVCELLYNYADRKTQDFFIDGVNPTPETIREVYAYLRSEALPGAEVYISIEDIAEGISLRNNMQVGSSLKALVDGHYIERFEVPGQRIRGTRLAQPEMPAHDVQLDTVRILEKRRRDESKLEAIIAYANSMGCRQVWMQQFFGEKTAEPCGTCDECRQSARIDLKDLNETQWLTLQKLLSGVARASFRHPIDGWQPKMGRGLITQMLVGSEDKRVKQMRLDQLSTHGLLKSEGTAFVKDLMDECLRRGLLYTTGGTRPLLGLTPLGDAAMRRAVNVQLDWPAQRKTGASASRDGGLLELTGDSDEELLQELKKKRIELARARSVPSYIIFSNKSLEALAAAQPITRDEAMRLPGIGESKARTILSPFLKIIARWRTQA